VRFWWVAQNKTYRHEVPGGYLWSPKRKKDGTRNPFYDFMREVSPGDVIFSFSDTLIKAIGIAASHAYEAPKPMEFGKAGAHWDLIGWRVDVRFIELKNQIQPSVHMGSIGKFLPDKYAPLQQTGAGKELYLTLLPQPLAEELINLVGREARTIVQSRRVNDEEDRPIAVGLVEWEEHQLQVVSNDLTVPETTRSAIVLARRGQGLFKQNVLKVERHCRVTKVDKVEHLRASHCKPWRDSSNHERLNGENGLLLTPSIDHLFDRGFIGFKDNGDLLVSPVAHHESLRKMGVAVDTKVNVGSFSDGQKQFLDFHREFVFLESRNKIA
jgi:putative restriction endonuclease